MNTYYKTSQEIQTTGDMELQIDNKWKTSGLPPLITYKPGQVIGETPEDKQECLNMVIKTYIGELDINTVLIYVPLFRMVSSSASLK